LGIWCNTQGKKPTFFFPPQGFFTGWDLSTHRGFGFTVLGQPFISNNGPQGQKFFPQQNRVVGHISTTLPFKGGFLGGPHFTGVFPSHIPFGFFGTFGTGINPGPFFKLHTQLFTYRGCFFPLKNLFLYFLGPWVKVPHLGTFFHPGHLGARQARPQGARVGPWQLVFFTAISSFIGGEKNPLWETGGSFGRFSEAPHFFLGHTFWFVDGNLGGKKEKPLLPPGGHYKVWAPVAQGGHFFLKTFWGFGNFPNFGGFL